MNGRPLSTRKKIQILVMLTLLAWATQTLLVQWGYGAEWAANVPSVEPTDPAGPAAPAEKFVPAANRAASGATLEFLGQAAVYGPEVRLKQVCRWSDADAGLFTPVADLVVLRFNGTVPYKSITLDELKALLADARVNLAVVKFSGPLACTVRRSDAKAEAKDALHQWIAAREVAAAVAAEPAAARLPAAVAAVPPATAPTGTHGDSSVRPLRQLLTEDLAVRLNLPAEQLQVNFNPKDEGVLNLSEPQFRFNIEGVRARSLGEVSWEVLVVHGSATQKVPIGANARAWQAQVVTTKPLSARQVIRAEDVAEHRALVDRLESEPVLTVSQVVGQQASRDLKPGTVFTSRMVDAVPLAKAGQFITVAFNQGGVRVKTVGRAMEGGSFGQTIRVKNEATGDVYDVLLTAPQEGSIGPAPAAETSVAAARGS